MIKKELKGLLGGIGAYASSLIYQKVIDATRPKLHDRDFPNLLIYNLPCNYLEGDFFESKGAIEEINNGLEVLTRAGCKKIWIACNSVHSFFDKLNHENVEFWVKPFINSNPNREVLVLGSAHTYKTKFYDTLSGASCIYPNKSVQAEIEKIILLTIQNKITQNEIFALQRILNKYAYYVIALACTELSVVYSKLNHKYENVIDSSEFIAREILK